MTIPSIAALTAIPNSITSPSTFSVDMDDHLPELQTFITEANAFGVAANSLAASMSSIAAGAVAAIPYAFSTTTTDADPGAGQLRLDNATQNSATAIRADLVGSDGETWTSVLDIFDDSTSTVKGFIMLQAVADGTKFLIFSVSALASPSGYKNITVANVASSDTSPFSDGDAVLLKFTRTGDKGETGSSSAAGLTLLSTVTASTSATVEVDTTFDSTYDSYLLVATGLTFSAASPDLHCRLKIGGTYLATNTYRGHITVNVTSNPGYAGRVTNTTQFEIINALGNASGDNVNFDMTIKNPTNTSFLKSVSWVGSAVVGTSGGNTILMAGVGSNTGTAALTGVQFLTNSGNIVAGKFRLYGIANS